MANKIEKMADISKKSWLKLSIRKWRLAINKRLAGRDQQKCDPTIVDRILTHRSTNKKVGLGVPMQRHEQGHQHRNMNKNVGLGVPSANIVQVSRSSKRETL